MVVALDDPRDSSCTSLLDLADGTSAGPRPHAVLQKGRLGRRGCHHVRARRRPALRSRRAPGAHGRGRRRRGLLARCTRSAWLVVRAGAGAGGGSVRRALDHRNGHDPLLAVRLVATLGRLDDEEPVRGDGAFDRLGLHVLGQGALSRELARDDPELVGALAVLAVDHNLVVDGLNLEVIAVEMADVQSQAEAFGVVGERGPHGRLERTAVEQSAPDVVVPVLVAPVLAVQPRVLVVQPTTKVVQLVRQAAAREQRGHGCSYVLLRTL